MVYSAKYTCCLCRKKFEDYGNNPEPLADGDEFRCCDECNEKKVIPARLGEDYHRDE